MQATKEVTRVKEDVLHGDVLRSLTIAGKQEGALSLWGVNGNDFCVTTFTLKQFVLEVSPLKLELYRAPFCDETEIGYRVRESLESGRIYPFYQRLDGITSKIRDTTYYPPKYGFSKQIREVRAVLKDIARDIQAHPECYEAKTKGVGSICFLTHS